MSGTFRGLKEETNTYYYLYLFRYEILTENKLSLK